MLTHWNVKYEYLMSIRDQQQKDQIDMLSRKEKIVLKKTKRNNQVP